MPSKPPRRENYSAGTKQLSSTGLSGRTKTPMNQPNQSRAETLRSLQPDAATQPHRTPEGAHSGARATDDLSCLCGHASWARARFRSMSRGIDLPSSRLLRAEVRCAARTPELCAGKAGISGAEMAMCLNALTRCDAGQIPEAANRSTDPMGVALRGARAHV